MDPHIYPTVNSRNHDKPYFAANFLNADAQPPMDWLYTLFYWSMLVGNGAEVNYEYYAYNEDDKSFTYFPKSWQQLAKEPEEFFYKHWTISGQFSFLDEWWQVIRRLSYIIELTPLGNNSIRATIFSCANIIDVKLRSKLAVEIYTKLVSTGLYAPETLPPLISADEIRKATGLVKPKLHAIEKKSGKIAR